MDVLEYFGATSSSASDSHELIQPVGVEISFAASGDYAGG